MTEPTVGAGLEFAPAGLFAEHARRYSALGWALVRVAGKRPLGKDWQTTKPGEPEYVAGMWSHWGLTYGMGVVLGTSGLAVIDVDHDDADDVYRSRFGELPETPTARTGRGRLQIFFRDPGDLTKTVIDGVELRVGAHQCVVPPSVHPDTGKPYVWERAPWDTPPAELPALAREYFNAASSNGAGSAAPMPEIIPIGEIDSTLTSLAGSMRRRGADEAAIRAALVATLPRCEAGHTHTEKDCARIARSVAKYPPAEDAKVAGYIDSLKVPPVEGEVDAAELLDDLVAHLRRFMVVTNAQVDVVALFALSTHCSDALQITPYLRVVGPTMRTGKSRLLELLEFLCFRPLKAGGASEAALFRSLAESPRTLIFDEITKALDRDPVGVEAVLLNGYVRGTPVLRCLGEGSRQEVVAFDVFGPKVLGGKGTVDRMILDRCFVITLRRKTRMEVVERSRRLELPELSAPLYARARAWGGAHADEVARARPTLPDELDDRGQDVAEPLLAIADIAGGDWPERARSAVVAIRTGKGDEADLGIELLTDIRLAFDGLSVDRISSVDLADMLARDPERPWKDYRRGEPISARQVAQLLADFEVRPSVHNMGGASARGYLRADFEDAWGRYL